MSIVLAGVLAGACGGGEVEPVVMTCAEVTEDLDARKAEMTATESGLRYEDLAGGRGAAAEAGQRVYTHYLLCSTDGQRIDSSLLPEIGEPLDFVVGAGGVIAGFDEGVSGMKAGGRRILAVPPEIGYGSQTLPGQAPGSDLIFYVQLVSIASE